MPLKKLANLTLETSAEYQPRSDLNIAFSSADRDTATFRFRVTQNNKPLLLGEENIKTSIVLIHSNGSKITERLTIVDGLNGLLEVVLPNDLLKMPGKVTAQVYVTKQSDEIETQAVVAERIFSFTIQESLAWKFDGETKLSYIIEFDELEEHLTERVLAIEKAIANGEDYVTQMKNALQEALTTIEAKVNSVESTVGDLKSSTIAEVTKLKGNATEDITTTANNAKTSVQDTASTAINSINSTATEATEHVDSKVIEFNQTVADNGFLTPEMLGGKLEELEWQKYQLTKEDGSGMGKSRIDILTLNTGFYEVWECTNTPLGDTGLYNLIVFGKNGRKFILATHSYENRTFINTIHTNGDVRGWKELTNNQTDTGWISFDTINGVKKDTTLLSAGAVKCSYRKVIANGVETCSIRINVENFTNDIQIAQLPENFTSTMQTFYLRSSTNRVAISGYITPNGVVKLNIPDSERSTWTSADYALGSAQWLN